MSVCGICTHEKVREINNELFAGRMIRAVAKKFELSIQALGRHRRRHLRFRNSKSQPATTLEEKFRMLSDDAERLQLAAECGGGANVREALQVLRLRMSLLELEGKVSGKLSDGSTTNVTVNAGIAAQQEPSEADVREAIREYLEICGPPQKELPGGNDDGQ
jgi:hypothetical protein